ncbi:nucleotidyl transferase AbiEii/AbiGii toxin family protein [Agromyces archimandritae]|uniref:Nucleotidyl transferase AbiEii/AbiGii toxin family protein n=1 Tax=Agromyces archimandritae TaxID=2781962 RepID=A0A975IQ21_9MICO|nr:nucleotidyl transferase AbiEii/AbiGii toxin family protein [Agromyces archimandritae]
MPVARARVMLCTLIVSQMLPDAVAVKGGMGVKLRFGERGTRATSDLDVSTRVRGEEFEQAFRARLAEGWGTVPASKGAQRRNPDAHARKGLDGELVQFGAYFGFGNLQPVELIDLEYQIAQKLHAVTDPTYVRAHDLVDLQLLWSAEPDLLVVQDLCVRTFGWRRQQAWPPLPLRPMDGWELAYADARAETEIDGGTPVLPDVVAARRWLERVIGLIVSSPAVD